MGSNPLRQDDPVNPFSIDKVLEESTRIPNRLEAKPTVPNTQLVRNDVGRVYRNAALSVNTGDTISWDAKTFDTTGLWNTTTSFIIPSTGKVSGPWSIYAQVVWPGTGAGVNRQIEIRKNGIVITTKAGPAATTYQDIADIIFDPSRGDIFTITVVQDSGGALALTTGSSKTYFSVLHTGV